MFSQRKQKESAVPVNLPENRATFSTYSFGNLLLNLSSASAQTIPAARQTILTSIEPAEAVKLFTGMIIIVAAVTIPTDVYKRQLLDHADKLLFIPDLLLYYLCLLYTSISYPTAPFGRPALFLAMKITPANAAITPLMIYAL